jgi:exonuclease VII small subunit
MATKRTPTQPSTINSLGQAQSNLEATTKELKSAQAVFERAQERLQLAEEAHVTATIALMEEVKTVRTYSRVTPVNLK